MYICKFCRNNNSFYSETGLFMHMDIHHSGKFYVKQNTSDGYYQVGTLNNFYPEKAKKKRKNLQKKGIIMTKKIIKAKL